ncbi:MAG: hypothetical protein U0835_13870 [Isosphaeraceae bacterium]
MTVCYLAKPRLLRHRRPEVGPGRVDVRGDSEANNWLDRGCRDLQLPKI